VAERLSGRLIALPQTASASISIWTFSLIMTPPGTGALKFAGRGPGW